MENTSMNARERYHLPRFAPPGISEDGYLREMAEERLGSLLAAGASARSGVAEGVYRARLEQELRSVEEMGCAGYFLFIADVAERAARQDIPLGPGRGAAPGALLTFCLGLSRIDPLHYGLLFERFLNPRLGRLPSVHLDVCDREKSRLMSHLLQVYGDRAAIVSPLAPDGTLLDGWPFDVFDHAHLLAIADAPLSEYLPLTTVGVEEYPATACDRDELEVAGMLQLALLPLTELTVIQDTLRRLAATAMQGWAAVEAGDYNDPAVYAMLAEGDSNGVFQLASHEMQQLMRRLRPDRFEDLIALIALYRPAPLNNDTAERYIARKQGREKTEFPHPLLETILAETHGLLLYQEQAMEIFSLCCNIPLGEGDMLRRALVSRYPQRREEAREFFFSNSVNNGFFPAEAERLFAWLQTFSPHSFMKSHAVSYAVIAYEMAWLKCHSPAIPPSGDGQASAE